MHEDTIALLGACTAQCDLAVSAMDGLIHTTSDHRLRQKLHSSMEDHRLLHSHARSLLEQYGGKEQHPDPVRKGMTRLKANVRMALGGDDTTVAYLVADGCDMGVRTLCKSQNRYCLAATDALFLTDELIRCQESLSASLRPYL